VITKIRYDENQVGEEVEAKLVQSLARLRISRCYGLLLHNDEALAGALGGKIAGTLHGLIRKGLVEKSEFPVMKLPKRKSSLKGTNFIFCSFRATLWTEVWLNQAPYNG